MKLVRFTRSHSDDDNYVATKFGPYPGPDAYLRQLSAELADGEFKDAYGITLAHAELAPVIPGLDPDTYLLYCHVPSEANESPESLAVRLQIAYDEGAVAGFFQIIT